MIKVAVFDDNSERRESLKFLINRKSDMACVGAFEDCTGLAGKLSGLNADVVLMDIDMPVVSGIEGVKQIRELFPELRIIMQTVFEDDEKIFASVLAGADGYILKKTPSAKLIEGIRDVVEGGAPMTASVARQVLKFFQQQRSAAQPEFALTAREKEILSLLVDGMSYKMIADRCSITFFTVNMHIKKIYGKLHVHSATEAVAKAIRHKIG